MEIDITALFNSDFIASDISGSSAERSINAARETWANAMADAEDREPPLLSTPAQLHAFRDHMRGFGAWEAAEIDNWDEQHCNALFLQLVAGDMRESGLDCDFEDIDWDEYDEGVCEGRHSGCIFRGDADKIYYLLGN